MKRVIVIALVLAATPAAAQPATADPTPPAAPAAQATIKRGVEVEVQLGSGQAFVMSGTAAQTLRPGAFFGYRTKWVTAGLGIELDRITSSQTFVGGSSEQQTTYWMALPGVRVTAARTEDRRTELLAQFDLGFGQTINTNNFGGEAPPTIHQFRVQAGPAIHFWLNRSFALGAGVGLRWEKATQSQAGTDTKATALGFYSAVSAIGVF